MATFVDPVADAAEACEGLRGLAHTTRLFEDPADTYRGLGEVSGSVRLLRQVLGQLPRAHANRHDLEFNDLTAWPARPDADTLKHDRRESDLFDTDLDAVATALDTHLRKLVA